MSKYLIFISAVIRAFELKPMLPLSKSFCHSLGVTTDDFLWCHHVHTLSANQSQSRGEFLQNASQKKCSPQRRLICVCELLLLSVTWPSPLIWQTISSQICTKGKKFLRRYKVHSEGLKVNVLRLDSLGVIGQCVTYRHSFPPRGNGDRTWQYSGYTRHSVWTWWASVSTHITLCYWQEVKPL